MAPLSQPGHLDICRLATGWRLETGLRRGGEKVRNVLSIKHWMWGILMGAMWHCSGTPWKIYNFQYLVAQKHLNTGIGHFFRAGILNCVILNILFSLASVDIELSERALHSKQISMADCFASPFCLVRFKFSLILQPHAVSLELW